MEESNMEAGNPEEKTPVLVGGTAEAQAKIDAMTPEEQANVVSAMVLANEAEYIDFAADWLKGATINPYAPLSPEQLVVIGKVKDALQPLHEMTKQLKALEPEIARLAPEREVVPLSPAAKEIADSLAEAGVNATVMELNMTDGGIVVGSASDTGVQN